MISSIYLLSVHVPINFSEGLFPQQQVPITFLFFFFSTLNINIIQSLNHETYTPTLIAQIFEITYDDTHSLFNQFEQEKIRRIISMKSDICIDALNE